ncbi:hypothetical protein [Bosea rubneri]|uniref:Uncharacterized protein n=1 Tax=Bosea rubneri TaxID=3075434 RepID=A0ABU3S4U8_9HYPH|nr:hypothetical protein [Bosea sp. ZW T0_25]MDU0339756.1 hypothetical protein [Bosea sp. ZW T0_25]
MEKLRHAAQQAKARKALDRKRKAETEPARPESRSPGEGMQPIESDREAPSGALDHAGQLPAMQRSKFARQ